MHIDSNQPRIKSIKCQLDEWKLGIPPKGI